MTLRPGAYPFPGALRRSGVIVGQAHTPSMQCYNPPMQLTPRAVLSNIIVRSALQQAWIDSNPDTAGEHEEGGFVIRDEVGEFVIARAVIYLVSPAGQVREVDDTEVVFRP